MSGPVGTVDAPGEPDHGVPHAPEVEVLVSREATVGGVGVRRALPRRGRRTVGAWCFADHFGPAGPPASMQVGPHPHTGLQTVTWLVAGEILHRDSLGSEQPIRPGQLNLMTAGDGVAHAEEQITRDGVVHGVQLWVALPDATRRGPAAFEHHAELPRLVLGDATATVLVGELGGHRSPARADTPLVGAELDLRRGAVAVPLDPGFEHALVVLEGAVGVGDARVEPGALAYLGTGRDELVLAAAAPARALLLGGQPFAEPVLMAWNFVGRSRDELVQAARDWNAGHDRFGTVDSPLARIPAPEPPL
ncbi:MAG: pirin family protein [Thermoanaerobacterales bacterium]|nr:pirin family protein [Thermoanaerobacterales bacterium]